MADADRFDAFSAVRHAAGSLQVDPQETARRYFSLLGTA